MKAYVGRSKVMFLGVSLRGGKGGTGPDAFPTDTRVPFRLIISKSASMLNQQSIYQKPNLLITTPRKYARILPNTIINRIHTMSTRNLLNPFNRILLRIQNNMISPMTLRQLSLSLRRRRPNHRRASRLRDLRREETEAACDGVDEDRLAGFDVVRFGHEGEGCEALDEDRAGVEGLYGIW